ncbi:MAG TPA: hypothetical protein VHM65_01565, partial [Candidatus Lustribacter sp.]|nr:hypothetical protein [Candidatus Lustribacter sp.]
GFERGDSEHHNLTRRGRRAGTRVRPCYAAWSGRSPPQRVLPTAAQAAGELPSYTLQSLGARAGPHS